MPTSDSLPPLFVASDIDGTFLDSRERVSPRLRAVVARMLRRGVPLSLATGRPPRWLYPVLEQIPVRPLCVCANGAIIYDSATDTIVHTKTLTPEVQRMVVDIAREALAEHGGVGVAVERAGRSAKDPASELFVVSPSYDHAWISTEHGTVDEDIVLSVPCTKLLLRNEALSSAMMFEIVAKHIPTELAHVTYSMSEGLLEVSAPGVTKRGGVQELAGLVGAGSDDVVCFGDMPNDIEMLQWAGLGVAMGNAAAKVKAAANEVTATNDDDGVAAVLERWF
ncbi:HAD family hydrolase [Corynebacterium sp. H78]|uniref:HAD family hydrolase n=1 Tax=Corynebacterium sp. H78 TaxID=3133417 RepID=UPI0030A81658